MLLRRLAYPCRYSDMIHRFARPVPEIYMITNTVMDFIFDHHAHRLTQWNPSIMNAQALQSYADAVSARGAPLQNCFGFVDGTVRSTDCKTWGAPKTGVQRSQKGAFAKISVPGITEWSYCKYVQTHR